MDYIAQSCTDSRFAAHRGIASSSLDGLRLGGFVFVNGGGEDA